MIDQRFPDQRFKALMGWAGIMIWDREVDPVDMLDAYLKRAAAESCGQCVPCRLGTAQLVRIMEAVCGGHGCEQDLERMCFLARQIALTARCDIGRTLARPVLDLLDQTREDFRAVIRGQRMVRRGQYNAIVTAPCISACPSNVDIPSYLEDVRMDRWDRAFETVAQDCPMPGTIGRVCVRPCESNCRRGDLDGALSIRAVKRFLADREMRDGLEAEHLPAPRQPQKAAMPKWRKAFRRPRPGRKRPGVCGATAFC